MDVRAMRTYLDYVCTEPLHTIRPALERFARDHGVEV
jgi:hypothetical protein